LLLINYKFMRLLVLLLIASASVHAQVGFNNPNPHPSSILDLTANNKGLLIPRLTTAERDALTASAAVGLLVYDTSLSGFYFFNAGQWFALNEFVKTAVSNDVSLSGNMSISGTISGNTLAVNSINTGNISSTGSVNTAALSANSITSSGSISGGALSITGFSTNALVPTGAIMMWSGSVASIPAGWALCDGSSGRPDLRGRFIVGYNNFDTDYSTIGNQGGEKRHTLTISEMPSHSHTIPGTNTSSFGGFGNVPGVGGGTVEGGGSTDNTGGNATHENRPPYYTLAFIIKL
jgi:microcystin-dependent protein